MGSNFDDFGRFLEALGGSWEVLGCSWGALGLSLLCLSLSFSLLSLLSLFLLLLYPDSLSLLFTLGSTVTSLYPLPPLSPLLTL